MIRDKYRIDAFIATGSMANVYAATHRNGTRVALKILHRELARDPSMIERFRREGYFANAIGHPGVVRAIDDDLTEDGCVFIVMELLEGENLEERRERMGGRIPVGEVLHIADAVLGVLAAAHGQEVLHRDLKPENVFITRKNEIKLLDFGVARFNDGRSSSDVTGVGMVLGTPAFMPPEQALGRREDVDARSDIWSVGATLFTVLTGEAVHAGGDAKTKLIATARTPARPLQDVLPDVPRAVAQVIDRALAFDKAQRWADANAMREALRWVRMSLHESAFSVERPTLEAVDTTPLTRRSDEEPTLAGRSNLDPHAVRPELRAAPRGPVSVDGVYTSAPPVTQRDVPPSMAVSEPTFSLRAAPTFTSHGSSTPAPAAPAPITERIPQHAQGPMERTELPTAEGSAARGAVTPPRTSELFREALAQAAGGTYTSSKEGGVDPPATARLRSPPATRAATDVHGAAHPTSLSLRTHPGLGGPPPRSPDPCPSPVCAAAADAPAHALTGRPSLPETPGPLLATIVPSTSRGAARVLVPIFIGALAGIVTYVVVVHQRAASARGAAAPPSTLPIASASDLGPPPPSQAVAPLPAPSSSESVATGPAPSSSEATITPPVRSPARLGSDNVGASAPSAPKPRARPRRRPKPPEAAGSATANGTATDAPAPDPAPEPPSSDPLPRGEE